MYVLYFLYSERVREEEKERKKQRDMAAEEEWRQIERGNERMKVVQEAGAESSGYQESCKQCQVVKQWGGESCFYHNPKFKYQ